MGKGDGRRPTQVPREVADANYEAVFGKRKLNNMSDEDREELNRDTDREASGPVSIDEHVGGNLHAACPETPRPQRPSQACDCGFSECNCGARG